MIERCLSSIGRQTLPLFVVLVDNGSTDNGRVFAERFCEANGLAFASLTEAAPGKVAALAAGLAATSTKFVATCDADTYYPPEYLAFAQQLLDSGKAVAAGAMLVTNPQAKLRSALEKFHWRFAAFLAPWQCHTGGAGQVFLTQALKEAGGFDTTKWNFVLEDHEVIGRIGLLGRIRYSASFWCSPVIRHPKGTKIGWSLPERICYHMTSRRSMPSFFEAFLAPRLMQRELWNIKLRRADHPQISREQSYARTILASLLQSARQSVFWPNSEESTP